MNTFNQGIVQPTLGGISDFGGALREGFGYGMGYWGSKVGQAWNTDGRNIWGVYQDIAAYKEPQSFGERFWRGIYENPPVTGVSGTVAGTTVSVSTAGTSISESPTTFLGLSVDIASWRPESNIEIGFVSRHFGAGTYPFESGVNPWVVHIGPSSISAPFVYGSIMLYGTDWEYSKIYGIFNKK